MSNCAFCAQLARVSWLLVNASNNKYSTDRTITGSSPAWDVWKGKNLYNLIPIRNTGSKVKENLFCKRSNKHTRNASFWAATRLEKRLQDLCNLIALSPGNQMSPFPHIMSFPSHNCHKSDKLLDYLPFAFSPFTFSFLFCWLKGQSPVSLVSAWEATTPYFIEMGNSRKKKVHLQQNASEYNQTHTQTSMNKP